MGYLAFSSLKKALWVEVNIFSPLCGEISPYNGKSVKPRIARGRATTRTISAIVLLKLSIHVEPTFGIRK
jgi:hypothetical protein